MVKPAAGPLPVALGPLQGLPIVVFVIGFVLTAWLMARRVRGALLLGIVLTTVLAIVLNGALAGWKGFPTPGAAQLPAAHRAAAGLLDVRPAGLRRDRAGSACSTTMLVTFSIMLSDFFDTMGTIIGVGGKGGFLDAQRPAAAGQSRAAGGLARRRAGRRGQQQQQHDLHRERGRRHRGRAHRAGRRW